MRRNVLSFRNGYVLSCAEKCSFLGEPVWLFIFDLKELGGIYAYYVVPLAVIVSAETG
ncbi:hypothetical protein M0P98_04825 [bacterium]|nr:hypothetical protein [bacterium]